MDKTYGNMWSKVDFFIYIIECKICMFVRYNILMAQTIKILFLWKCKKFYVKEQFFINNMLIIRKPDQLPFSYKLKMNIHTIRLKSYKA